MARTSQYLNITKGHKMKNREQSERVNEAKRVKNTMKLILNADAMINLNKDNIETTQHGPQYVARLDQAAFVAFLKTNGLYLKHNGMSLALLDKDDGFKYGEVEL